jgi:hypothetical protein
VVRAGAAWRPWFIGATIGEVAGFFFPALLAPLVGSTSAGVMTVVLVLAGMVEGGVLGLEHGRASAVDRLSHPRRPARGGGGGVAARLDRVQPVARATSPCPLIVELDRHDGGRMVHRPGGLFSVTTPLWHESQAPAATVLVGLLGATVMAATVAAITGLALSRLLAMAGRARP